MRIYHAREIESEMEREAARTSAWVLVTYGCYGEWHLSRKVRYQTSSFFLTIIRRRKETDNYIPIISRKIVPEINCQPLRRIRLIEKKQA